jgi:hypothetical protein
LSLRGMRSRDFMIGFANSKATVKDIQSVRFSIYAT